MNEMCKNVIYQKNTQTALSPEQGSLEISVAAKLL
jgi:hypothetical protein